MINLLHRYGQIVLPFDLVRLALLRFHLYPPRNYTVKYSKIPKELPENKDFLKYFQ
jgi:hypothetical protein